MDMNNTDFFKKVLSGNKTVTVLLFVFALGVMIMIISGKGYFQKDVRNTESETGSHLTFSNSADDLLEKELESILSSIDGFGKTKVMIKYNSSSEKAPLAEKYNSQEKIFKSTASSESDSYITKDMYAQIEGVIIVAQGAGNELIKNEIRVAVSEMLGTPIHKVSILKMSDGGN